MLKIKNDFYAKYLDTDGRFWEVKKGIYRIQVEKRKNLLGFKNYDEVELKDKMFIDVSKNKISSAYRVRTYCNYKDGKYDLSNITDNTVILFPDLVFVTAQLDVAEATDRKCEQEEEEG